LALEPGEALQSHVEDGLRLHVGERESSLQRLLGLGRRLAGADQRHHLVQVVDRDLQAFQDMRPLLGLSQLELRAPDHHLAAVNFAACEAI